MAEFSVNAQRFDPYKNFKFRVRWDGRFVAGISKVGALKRTTEVVEHRVGGDPSTGRKSPGRSKYEAIMLERGVTPRPRVRRLGEQGLVFRGRAGGGKLAGRFPQGHHHRNVQRGRAARHRLPDFPLLGVGVPGPPGTRQQCQRSRHPVDQTGERRLDPGHRCPGTR